MSELLRGDRTIERDGDGDDDSEDVEDGGERAAETNDNGRADGVTMLMTAMMAPFNGGDDACLLRRAPMIDPERSATAKIKQNLA